MYKLPYFVEQDQQKILAFMKEYPFAIITANTDTYPVATHIPLDVQVQDNSIFFTGHMMKHTDHHKAFVKNKSVLVVFNGPHCYVSASWYNDPRVGSTWNYMSVHAKGEISFADEEGTKAAVEAITNKYEGLESAAAFAKLSPEYINRLVKAIAGFTIEVKSIDNVFKLSQNHEAETKQSIIEHLYARGGDNEKKIATEMQHRVETAKTVK